MNADNKYKLVLVILGICLLPVLSGCVKKRDSKNELVKINGLLYTPGSKTPFTGHEKANLKSRILEYDVVNGVKQGGMKISYSDGQPQIVGQMKNNMNEGHWKYFYENYRLESEGDFLNDMPQGVWIWYYIDGKVREKGNYSAGKREGKWLTYDESGKISSVKNFKNGELVKK